jgi:hypothetical protein
VIGDGEIGDDEITLSFKVTAEDGDGDTVDQTLEITVEDDGPVVNESTTVTNWGGEARFDNSFGYFVDEDGDGDWDQGEGDGTIVWGNASNDNKGATVTIDGYAKEDLGFFIIPDVENDGFTDGQSGVDLSNGQHIDESIHFLGHPGDASEDWIPEGALGRRYYFDDNGGDPDDDDFSDVQVTVRSEPDAILDEDGLQASGSAPYDGIAGGPGDVPGEDTVASGNLPIDFGADGPGAISFEQNEGFVKTAQGDYVKTLSEQYLKWHWDGDSTLTAQATDDDPTTETDPSSTPGGDPFLSVEVTDTATGAYKVTQHKPLKHEPATESVLTGVRPEDSVEDNPYDNGDGTITRFYEGVVEVNDGSAYDLKVQLVPKPGSDFDPTQGSDTSWVPGDHYNLNSTNLTHSGGIQGGADFIYTIMKDGHPVTVDRFGLHIDDIDLGQHSINKEIFTTRDADGVRVSSDKVEVEVDNGALKITSQTTGADGGPNSALLEFSDTSQVTLTYMSDDKNSANGKAWGGYGNNGTPLQIVDPDDYPDYLPATPAGWGYEDNLDLALDYTVTDGDGDTADGTLDVTVDDDSPMVEIDELNSSPVGKDGLAQIELTAETEYGADGPAACDTTAWALHVPDDGVKSGLKSSGADVYLYQEGNRVVGRVDDANGDEALSLRIATDGDGKGQLLVEKLKGLDGSLNEGALFASVDITDGDGDTATDRQDLQGMTFAQISGTASTPNADILRFDVDGSVFQSYDEDALQTALDDAGDGDTIWLSKGEFGKEDDKGYTITVDNDDVNIFGANAGTSAQGDRVAESVVHGYLDVNGDDVTVDGLRVESTHESGGDKFLRLDGDDTTFVNNIVTLDTPRDSGGNGVVADPDNDTIESNILAWQGNLMGRGDTGFDDAPDCNNDLYGAYWGNDGPRDEGWQTEFIIGTASDDMLGPNAVANQSVNFNFLDTPAKLNAFVRGEAGADTIEGTPGDDTLVGGEDDDDLTGGGGFDTAVFSGSSYDYHITYNAGTYEVSGPDGTDTVTGVEAFEFDGPPLIDPSSVPDDKVKVFDVNGGLVATYTSIQSAIDATGADGTDDGYTVQVGTGTYDEDITVDKSVRLIGPNASLKGADSARGGEAVIEGNVEVTADFATLAGFTVTPSDASTNPTGEAIRVSGGADNVTIANNIVENFKAATGLGEDIEGITAFSNNSNAVDNLSISGNLVTDIGDNPNDGAVGIALQGNVTNASVYYNTVEEIGANSAYSFGIVVRDSASLSPDDARITNNVIENMTSSGAKTYSAGVGIGLESEYTEVELRGNTVNNADFLLEEKGYDPGSGSVLMDRSDLEAEIGDNSFDKGAYVTDASGKIVTQSNVQSGGDIVIFADIAEALAIASSNDTVNLLPGTYNDIQEWSGEDIVGTELLSDDSLAPFASYGDNLVVGTSGRDRLFGGDDNDILVGGDGKDILVGSGGQDQLWGNEKDGTGSAQDIFVLDGSTTVADADEIMDYSGPSPSGDGDILDITDVLDGSVLTDVRNGNLDLLNDGLVSALDDGTDTSVKVDANNDGNEQEVAKLDEYTGQVTVQVTNPDDPTNPVQADVS